MTFMIPNQSWNFSFEGKFLNDSLYPHVENKTSNFNLIHQYGCLIIPSATIFISLVNIVNRAKLSPCVYIQKHQRPQLGNIEHQIILLCLLTAFLAISNLIITIPKVFNISYYFSNATNLNLGHKIVSQLPAFLTLNSILRLVILWLTLVILADRYSFLTRVETYPITSLIILKSQSNSLETSNSSGSSYRESHNPFHRRYRRLRSLLLDKMCCVDNFDVGCCYDFRRRYNLWMRSSRFNYQNFDNAMVLAKSLRPTVLLGFLLCLIALATCIPLLGAFKLYKTLDQNKLCWHLELRMKHAFYEYFWASINLLLPTFLLSLGLISLLVKLAAFREKINKSLAILKKEMHVMNLANESNVIETAIAWIIRDSWSSVILGLIITTTWIPDRLYNICYRLSLLNRKSIENAAFPVILFQILGLLSLIGELLIQIFLLIIFLTEIKFTKKLKNQPPSFSTLASCVSSDNSTKSISSHKDYSEETFEKPILISGPSWTPNVQRQQVVIPKLVEMNGSVHSAQLGTSDLQNRANSLSVTSPRAFSLRSFPIFSSPNLVRNSPIVMGVSSAKFLARHQLPPMSERMARVMQKSCPKSSPEIQGMNHVINFRHATSSPPLLAPPSDYLNSPINSPNGNMKWQILAPNEISTIESYADVNILNNQHLQKPNTPLSFYRLTQNNFSTIQETDESNEGMATPLGMIGDTISCSGTYNQL